MDTSLPVQPQSHTRAMVAIVFALLVVAAGVWFFMSRADRTGGGVDTKTVPEATGGFGATLYDQSTNPVQDKIPESSAPTPNPLEAIYKNPFE